MMTREELVFTLRRRAMYTLTNECALLNAAADEIEALIKENRSLRKRKRGVTEDEFKRLTAKLRRVEKERDEALRNGLGW